MNSLPNTRSLDYMTAASARETAMTGRAAHARVGRTLLSAAVALILQLALTLRPIGEWPTPVGLHSLAQHVSAGKGQRKFDRVPAGDDTAPTPSPRTVTSPFVVPNAASNPPSRLSSRMKRGIRSPPRRECLAPPLDPSGATELHWI